LSELYVIFSFCDPLAAQESETKARNSMQNRSPENKILYLMTLLSLSCHA
jgi:hypothetical protein